MSSRGSLRRLQRVGRATYSISLPKDWVARKGLRPGDLLEILEEPDGGLKIAPLKAASQKPAYTINVELCKVSGQLSRLIKACYRRGCERIELVAISGLKSERITEAVEAVESLPGLEVIEQTDKRILIQGVLDPSMFSVEDLLRREQLMVSTIFHQISEFTMSRSYELIKSIKDLRKRVHQVNQLIKRLGLAYLQRRGRGERLSLRSPIHAYQALGVAQHMENLARSLERIGEELLSLSRKKIRLDREVARALRERVEEALTIFERSIAAFLSANFDQSMNAISEAEKISIQGLEKAYIGRVVERPELLAALTRVEQALIKVVSESSEIAEKAFDLFIEKETPLCMLKQ